MNTVEFIRQSLGQVHYRLTLTCGQVTPEQVLWRPAPHANNIGFILWHVARAQDNLASRLAGATSLWESKLWYVQFGQPKDALDPGDRMGLQALPLPDLGTLTAYLNAAHQRLVHVVLAQTSASLDAVPNASRPLETVAALLRHQITHQNNHHGQIDFIRGLQDTAWDLPPGTGMVMPVGNESLRPG